MPAPTLRDASTVVPGNPKVLPTELQYGQGQTHKYVLKEEHLQLDPTKDRAILERLLSTHTSSVVTAGRGISFFCPSKLLIMCEPVSSANYRFTVTKEIALNTTLDQVRNKQIEMFNALLLSY